MRDCNLQLKNAKEIWDNVFNSKVYAFSSVVPSDLPKKVGIIMNVVILKDCWDF